MLSFKKSLQEKKNKKMYRNKCTEKTSSIYSTQREGEKMSLFLIPVLGLKSFKKRNH